MSRMEGLDRTVPPPPGPLRSFDFPEVEKEALDTGLDLRVVRNSRLPVVTVLLVLDAGEAAVPEERGGEAVLAGNALDGGTQDRTGAALAEALEGIGSALSVHTGWDSTSLSLTALPHRLPQALALLAEVVQRPAFPEEEVARFRSQRLASIQQRFMDPGSRADDEAARLIHADGVAYGRPLGGTRPSVEGLGREELAAFAWNRYRPARGGLVVVGDVDPAEIRTLVREELGEWTGGGGALEPLRVEPRHRERRVVVVHRPGAVQSELRIGHLGVPRDTPDYHSLLVLNSILGGTFTSRLNLNLRERHGFTYGVRSGFSFRRGAGPFLISTAVGTEQTAPAVREAMAELEGLLEEGPREEEVASARDYLAGIFPLRIETTAQVASRIGELIVYGLPADTFARYRNEVRAVTREAALDAGRRHLHPEAMTVVVVGDAPSVRGPLEELGLGPVDVVGAP